VDLFYTATYNIGYITLNRRHRRNGLTFDMYKRIGEIHTTVETEKDSDQVKVLILSGSVDAAFAMGKDI
jgi:enoyl-CoA hydratase